MPRTRGNKFRFSKTAIDKLPPHPEDSASREKEYSDTEAVGLHLAVTKSGRRFFDFRYTFKRRKRALRLGEYPAIDIDEARRLALECRAQLCRGVDPRAERDRPNDDITFEQFVEEHYLPHARRTKKSWKDDERKLENELVPKLGHLLLRAVEPRDVRAHVTEVSERASGPTANRHLALLGRMFALAEQWEMIPEGSNPTRKVEKFRENANRTRFLEGDELKRFLQALAAGEERLSCLAIKFLLCSGMRKGEAFGLTWDRVDLEKGTAYLPDTKSGKPRTVILNGAAKAVLEEVGEHREPGNPHVFPGSGRTGHLTVVRKTFEKVCEAAAIEGLTRHDLRHTFCSLLANGGTPLQVIRDLAGHSDVAMTQRYAHLQDTTLRAATESVAAQLDKAVGM